MVMKDKVVKYNHKKGYYTMKKVSLCSLVMASAFFACFIPTYVNYNQSLINEQVKADNVEDIPQEETETEVPLSYNA